MSTTAYVNRLKESRTYKMGVIEDIEEYGYKVRFGGMLRTLPSLPQANDDRHVIVIEVTGNQPSVFSVLTRSNQVINPTARSVDKLVFIFFSVKPQRITISAPPEGYLMGDGDKIFADIEVGFCITDVEKFWQSDKDPIANLESQVVNEAKRYFSKLNSVSLINTLDISQRKLEKTVIDSQLNVIMDGLQAEISQKKPNGIRIDQVNAGITLTRQLQDFLGRMRANLFDQRGMMDRSAINARLESDETFAPYKLRDLIMALDSSLLENFYSLEYGQAMRQVHEKLAQARKNYLDLQNNIKIKNIQQAIKMAQDSGLNEEDILDLKDELGIELKNKIKSSMADDNQSNREYIRHLLGDKQPNRLTDSTDKPPTSKLPDNSE